MWSGFYVKLHVSVRREMRSNHFHWTCRELSVKLLFFAEMTLWTGFWRRLVGQEQHSRRQLKQSNYEAEMRQWSLGSSTNSRCEPQSLKVCGLCEISTFCSAAALNRTVSSLRRLSLLLDVKLIPMSRGSWFVLSRYVYLINQKVLGKPNSCFVAISFSGPWIWRIHGSVESYRRCWVLANNERWRCKSLQCGFRHDSSGNCSLEKCPREVSEIRYDSYLTL